MNQIGAACRSRAVRLDHTVRAALLRGELIRLRRRRAGVAVGPMHGGANESSMRMLEEIESVDQVPAFLRREARSAGISPAGFGNSRYRHRDPRADILRETSHRVLAEVGMSDRLLQVAMALEDVALTDPYFVDMACRQAWISIPR